MTLKRIRLKGVTGAFPVDMLRHDEAWPEASVDSNAIKTSFGFRHGRRSRWEVTIITRAKHAPSTERWLQFNTEVVSVDVIEEHARRRGRSGR